MIANVSGNYSLNLSALNTYSKTEKIGDVVLTILYTCVIIFGITGNSLVIAIVYRKKAMQTTTNYLLVNLAITDILTLLGASQSQVFRLAYTHPGGRVGDYLCKFITGGTIVTIALTVATFNLALIAIERHNALIIPLNETIRLKEENVIRPIAAFWIVSILLSVIPFMKAGFSESQGKCVDVWDIDLAYNNREFVFAMVILKGIIPYIIILYCYTKIIRDLFFSKSICSANVCEEDFKRKRRIAKLLISVTVAFYCCYLPYALLVMYVAAMDPRTLTSQRETLRTLQIAARFLLYFESCLNPVIYPFHSTNFRRELKNMLPKITSGRL